MLLFNMPKKKDLRPVNIAKGVNKNENKIRPAKPRFEHRINPFDNYTEEMLVANDKSIMGFNKVGNFTATQLKAESERKAFHDMANNTHIINLVNDKRRRNF